MVPGGQPPTSLVPVLPGTQLPSYPLSLGSTDPLHRASSSVCYLRPGSCHSYSRPSVPAWRLYITHPGGAVPIRRHQCDSQLLSSCPSSSYRPVVPHHHVPLEHACHGHRCVRASWGPTAPQPLHLLPTAAARLRHSCHQKPPLGLCAHVPHLVGVTLNLVPLAVIALMTDVCFHVLSHLCPTPG